MRIRGARRAVIGAVLAAALLTGVAVAAPALAQGLGLPGTGTTGGDPGGGLPVGAPPTTGNPGGGGGGGGPVPQPNPTGNGTVFYLGGGPSANPPAFPGFPGPPACAPQSVAGSSIPNPSTGVRWTTGVQQSSSSATVVSVAWSCERVP